MGDFGTLDDGRRITSYKYSSEHAHITKIWFLPCLLPLIVSKKSQIVTVFIALVFAFQRVGLKRVTIVFIFCATAVGPSSVLFYRAAYKHIAQP